MLQQSLVLLKPDAVQRAIMGNIITRFENAGLKIVGMKMVWADKKTAEKHYTDDITKRRGEKVRNLLLDFIRAGPVVAMVLEGIDAIENIRRIVGPTEPKSAPPGTIRGDFCHVSFAYADKKDCAVKNVVHSSGNESEAKQEISVWFTPKELHSYKRADEYHHLG